MFCHVLSPIGKIGTKSIPISSQALINHVLIKRLAGHKDRSHVFNPVSRVKCVRGVDNKYSGSKLTLRDRKTWKFAVQINAFGQGTAEPKYCNILNNSETPKASVQGGRWIGIKRNEYSPQYQFSSGGKIPDTYITAPLLSVHIDCRVHMMTQILKPSAWRRQT